MTLDKLTKIDYIDAVAGTFSGGLTGTTANFSGNVAVGGVLTYEDVTNIDAVGLITARSGIIVSGGNINVNSGGVTVSNGINVGGATGVSNLNVVGVATFASRLTISGDASGNTEITESGSGNLFIKADDTYFNNAAGSAFRGSFTSSGLTIPGNIVHSSDTNTTIGFPTNDAFTVTTAGYARMEFVGDYIYINSQQTGNNRGLMYNYPAGSGYRGALGFYASVSSSASDQRNITFNTNGNTQKLEINPTGLNVSGIVTATSISATSAVTSANGFRNVTVSTASPSGGSDGDVWIKYS
tara:strand:+ start:1886 stop:2779 length:894 start_codon:yes stop_codon:yes gene_type:complete